MRIVGGALRGRRLAGPKSSAIRPTSDRLRETIFDILAHAYAGTIEGAAVIDEVAMDSAAQPAPAIGGEGPQPSISEDVDVCGQ